MQRSHTILTLLYHRLLLLLVFTTGLVTLSCAQTRQVKVSATTSAAAAVSNVSVLIDTARKLDEKSILLVEENWEKTTQTPVLQVINYPVWIKFEVTNNNSVNPLYIDIPYPYISLLVCYSLQGGTLVEVGRQGNILPYANAPMISNGFVFPLKESNSETGSYYFKIESKHPILFPVLIKNERQLQIADHNEAAVIGIYVGIIIAIFFYNLFLFISTGDKSYLIYISFLFWLGLAQLSLSGYLFKYVWPGMPSINNYALTITSAMAGILGIYFSIYFLQLKKFLPKLIWFFWTLIAVYAIAIICSLTGKNDHSYQILNIAAITGGVSLLVASLYVAQSGYKPAYFYFVAWMSFLIGIIIISLRNYSILPYNDFTTYVVYVGSAIEVVLLSIALADKINILREEKDASQVRSLQISQENERLVREQNVVLEERVTERTFALQKANGELSNAYDTLKDAQIQLVEAEKMASLGQLTAGIAHEINNPINFVKSNIKPLKLDIQDLFEVMDEYEKLHEVDAMDRQNHLVKVKQLRDNIDINYLKEEVRDLLKGIEDGADRTAEIVQGLRNFSRLDESQVKQVDVHEGLDSTLVMLRNNIPDYIKVVKTYEANGHIECLAGKLNQVFLNILNNAVQAIKSMPDPGDASIQISTANTPDDDIEISFRDTGPGMTAEVKQRLFDPFFTTKDVGEGTGLGLAIVAKIILEHQGKIEVISEVGKGAEFRITLHRTIPVKTSS